MRITSYEPGAEELIFQTNRPEKFMLESLPYSEKEYVADHKKIKGAYKEIFFNGVQIGFGDFHLSKSTLIHLYSQTDVVTMHFAFSGKDQLYSRSENKQIDFEANQHNLIYNHDFKEAINWNRNELLQIFRINLWPSFLGKYLPKDVVFDSFRNDIARKQPSVLTQHNYPITPQMLGLIKQIIACDRVGSFKRMYLESHVIELLMLQLEQIANHDCEVFCVNKKHHEEKLHAVKDILSKNLVGPFTLNDLALRVGTNEFTLKKGFKELFGTTVFGFWRDLKMQRAQELLAEGLLNIAEISSLIGFKNPQHFSTAFKRYFGYSPSQLQHSYS
ncbi:MAG: AraC family transcriptional regulator [Bacteroidota bacterium]